MLTCSLETITPDIAHQWLGLVGHKNRTLNAPTVRRIAGILSRGEWREDCTDAIGLAADGSVVNGQHRLTAVVETGRPIQALVLRGVQPDVIKILDQGRPRNFAQWLEIQGYDNARTLASACDWLYRFQNGVVGRPGPAPTVPQQEKVLEAGNGPLEEAVKAALPLNSPTLRFPPGPGAALFHILAGIDRTAAAELYQGVASGELLTTEDAAYWVRALLLADNATTDKKASPTQKVAWFVNAWNALRAERLVRSKRALQRFDPFPAISGWEQQEMDVAS